MSFPGNLRNDLQLSCSNAIIVVHKDEAGVGNSRDH